MHVQIKKTKNKKKQETSAQPQQYEWKWKASLLIGRHGKPSVKEKQLGSLNNFDFGRYDFVIHE